MKTVIDDSLHDGAVALRTTVFGDEQGFTGLMDEVDDDAIHVRVVDDNDKTLATCRAYREDPEHEPDVWHIGRVAVSRESRGTGLGRVLVEAAEHAIAAHGGRVIDIAAQHQAQGFYESLGYQVVSDAFYEQDYKHYLMRKELSAAE